MGPRRLALLWGTSGRAAVTMVVGGLLVGATAHWWVALLLVDVLDALDRRRPGS